MSMDREEVAAPQATTTDETPEPSSDAAPKAPDHLSADEMLGQLGVMARQIAGDAPPAMRDASVVAAELTAIAARNTGPIARVIAEATDDAGLRLAGRLDEYVADTRRQRAEEDQASADSPPDDGQEPGPA